MDRPMPKTKRARKTTHYAAILFASLLFGVIQLSLAAPESAPANAAHKTTTYRSWIIHRVFGSRYGNAAVRVAKCESGLNPHARNGQYRGAFQMGYSERSRYGHGSGLWKQARSAHKYFIASGRDWSPWQCKP